MNDLYFTEIEKLQQLYKNMKPEGISMIEETLGLTRIGIDSRYSLPVYKMDNELNRNKIKVKKGLFYQDMEKEEVHVFREKAYVNKIKVAYYLNLLPVVDNDVIVMAPAYQFGDNESYEDLGLIALEQFVLSGVHCKFRNVITVNKKGVIIQPLKTPLEYICYADINADYYLIKNNTKEVIEYQAKQYKYNASTSSLTVRVELIQPGETFYCDKAYFLAHKDGITTAKGMYSKTKNADSIPIDVRLNWLGAPSNSDNYTLLAFNVDADDNTISCVLRDNKWNKNITMTKQEMINSKDVMKYTNIDIIDNNIQMTDGTKIYDIPHNVVE